jgi:hypothetical protein
MRTVLIVISPSPDAQFSTHLKKTLLQPQNRSMILASPMMVHSMLISMHLPSWQEYLEYHEALLLKLVRNLLVRDRLIAIRAEIIQDMKSACSVLEQPLVTFDTLKEIREVEKRILPVDPLLKTLEGLLDSLQEASLVFRHARGLDEELFTTIQTALTTMRVETSSYRVQAMYMQRKTQSAAQSVLDALNLAFQQLAQDQSKNTFVMAKSAREDSVAIRAITLVTSFYLPFSFVAVGQPPFESLRQEAKVDSDYVRYEPSGFRYRNPQSPRLEPVLALLPGIHSSHRNYAGVLEVQNAGVSQRLYNQRGQLNRTQEK